MPRSPIVRSCGVRSAHQSKRAPAARRIAISPRLPKRVGDRILPDQPDDAGGDGDEDEPGDALVRGLDQASSDCAGERADEPHDVGPEVRADRNERSQV